MYLKKLYLLHFRNYDNLLLTLHNGINIIYGENAQGKTNISPICARSRRMRITAMPARSTSATG